MALACLVSISSIGATSPAASPAAPPVLVAAKAPPALVPDALGPVPADDPRMTSYSHGNYALRAVHVLWSAGLLSIVVFSGFGGLLLRRVGSRARSPNLSVALYAPLLGLVLSAGELPFAFYVSYVREKRYGFTSQTLGAWLLDRGKGLGVFLVLQTLVALVLYAVLRRFGRRAWIPGSFLAVLIAIAVIAVAPVLIAPLFNRFEPLRDAALRRDILDMARREGIPAREVYQVDASRQSGHTNAYVAGLLGTQRIVLYDTLLERFAPREIESVMGHEMGHYVLHHVWKTVAFLAPLIAAGLFLADRIARRVIAHRPGLGIADVSEPSSLPLILLILSAYLVVVGPLVATFSRSQEAAADRFGLAITGDPEAAASVFLKFGLLDLDEYHVDPWIERLLYSHPSLAHRIGMAQEYARSHGAAAPSRGGAASAQSPPEDFARGDAPPGGTGRP